ncbi:hypothetical protein AB0G32_00850 [Streptomyces sp. NPDC023723]|uniref:hypothetical protein n=1 Tax=Streptomyces sp. NPDC023723 TaxID=3154323 RepID=UPI0033EE3D31
MGRPPVRAPLFAEPGSGSPLARVAPGASGGHGLHLVREYAEKWGAWSLGEGLPGRRGAGKLLWFEVGEPRPGPAPV